MIIEVHRSSEMNGLGYNLKKLHECKAEIIASKWIPKDASGEEIAAILLANTINRNVEKPFAHLNINPAIEDWENGLTVDELAEMSVEAVEKLFPNVPYLIFVHKDISRWHAHAVCPCITRDGRLISDRFEWNRAMRVSRELEIKHNLERALQHTDERRIERAEPIIYEDGDLARKTGDVIALAKTYSFATIGEFDAFLRLYNVTVEQLDNDKKRGLTYSILKDGKRVGRPLIATKVHGASLSAIESCIKQTTESARKAAQIRFKQKISSALEKAKTYEEFKTVLETYSIRVVDRIGKDGDIIGVTFVDDEFKNIMNGSAIDRNFSYSNLQKNFIDTSTQQGITTDQGTYFADEVIEVEERLVETPKTGFFSALTNFLHIQAGVTSRHKKKRKRGF